MSESGDKTASSLAIVEKRPQRPGGCVGIFFQLFDWNRRFAKKKLFSKKLLPPAHPKQAARKFGGDEKLPKLRLIANENSGGFPNMKKNGNSSTDVNQKPGMRSPSLVARLMGLESMPAAQQRKSKETSVFGTNTDEGNKFLSTQHAFGLNVDKGNGKHELRPQKLQKTGASERQVLTRFTTEALQFKNALSRSRKHRPKLISPVKSPRMASGRNSSRLMNAATRILEPGLQNTIRAKSALTYSSYANHIPKNMEGEMASPDLPKRSNCHVFTDSISKPFKGQSCKHCGSQLDLLDSSPILEETPLPSPSSVPGYLNPNVEELKRSSDGPATSSFEQERWRVCERYQELSVPFAVQPRNNRKPPSGEGQIQWNLKSQQCKPQNDVPSASAFKHKTQRHNQLSVIRDGSPQRSNIYNMQTNRVSSAANAVNQAKGVSLNRNASSRAESRMPLKADNNTFKCDADRKSCNARVGSLSPVRKRRSVGVNQNGESSGFSRSTITRQSNVRYNGSRGKDTRTGLDCGTSNNKNSDVISFTFNSPIKQKSVSGVTHNISVSDESGRKVGAEKLLPLSGDALGALLQQKLKELACQGEDELGTEGSGTKRTSATILQELISALTVEKSIFRDDMAVECEEKSSCRGPHLKNKRVIWEAKAKAVRTSLGCLHEDEHLSPGSVLEASFSNDSCLSSSVDDGSAHNLFPDSVESSDGLQLLEPEGNSGIQLVEDLVSRVSEMLYSLGFANSERQVSKLAFAEEVLLNAELIFMNAALKSSNGSKSFSLILFLIHDLETLASDLCTDGGYSLSFEEKNHGNQLKEFVLDCVIEYLDSRYGRYPVSGYRTWSRLPLCMTSDKLIIEVVEEVRGWNNLAEKITDEIIESEMGQYYGKWTDFEIEAYESGAEIDKDVLHVLIDEIVVDLCEGKLGSLRN